MISKQSFCILFLLICFSCNSDEKTIAKYLKAISQEQTAEQVRILEQNKDNQDLVQALLITKHYPKFSFNKNNRANEFKDIKDQIHRFGRTDRLEKLIQKQTPKNNSSNENWGDFLIYKYYLEQKIQKAGLGISSKDLEIINDFNWNNDWLNRYKTIQYLKFKAHYLHKQAKNYYAIITLNRALFLCKKHHMQDLIQDIEFDLRTSLLTITLTDPNIDLDHRNKFWQLNRLKGISDGDSSKISTLNYFKLTISEQVQSHDTTSTATFRKDSIYHYITQMESNNPLKNNALLASINFKASIANSWISIGELELAKKALYEILEISKHLNCNLQSFLSLIQLLYLEEDNTKKLQLLVRFDKNQSCFDERPYQEYLKYVFLDCLDEYELLSALDLLQAYRKQRKLAKEMWGTEPSFHLQDLYALNTSSILKKYQQIPASDKDNLDNFIISLIHETKGIELKRQRHLSNANLDLKLTNPRLGELIKQTNDLMDVKYDSHPIYEELYQLYKERSKRTKKDNEAINKTLNSISNGKSILQSKLKVNDAILNIFRSNESYWFYVLSKEKFELFDISSTELDSSIQVINKKIKNREDLSSVIESIKEMLWFLPHQVENLTIFPDGELIQFPFELISNTTNEIQYHYDMTEWILQNPVALQNSSIRIYSYSDESTIRNEEKRNYTELPFGYEECVNINNQFKNRSILYKGKQFTKETLQNAKKNDIIHISTHAAINPANRLDNYLLLRNDQEKPEKLYSFEIESWSSSPALVVLSACDTGKGIHKIGAGTYSISRALFMAGSDTVIKSLWQVNERATAEFMSTFYQQCNLNINVSEALHNTKLLFKQHDRYDHPYYWSGFILEGNNQIHI